MGSYVISVSAGTGCYRHIQISKSATLHKLHAAIIDAFDFYDDHEHAFFMDNRYWSIEDAFYSSKILSNERLTKSRTLQKLRLIKGDQFKYIFDFGTEWRFQCKVLRELEEQTDTPRIIRSVGESPEQYPYCDDGFDEDDDYDEDDETLSPEEIENLFSEIPLTRDEIDCIRLYFDAAARLYGLIPLNKLHALYNSQNPPVDAASFLMTALVIDCITAAAVRNTSTAVDGNNPFETGNASFSCLFPYISCKGFARWRLCIDTSARL